MARNDAGSNQTFKRNSWVAKDAVAQAWVGEIVWKIMGGPSEDVKEPQALDILIEAFEACRQSICHNGLQGMALAVYGERLRKCLGDEFYQTVEFDQARSDIFVQELHWLLGPRQGGNIVVLGDFPMRKFYAQWGQKQENPRLIRDLTIWTPTLSTREEVGALLLHAGYEKSKGDNYIYTKTTRNIRHSVVLRGTLWESSKNWSTDIERSIWDRAAPDGLPGSLKLDPTDQFLVAMRTYAVDTLLGGGVELLDLVQMLSQNDTVIDWERLRSIKNAFAKPDWFWATMLALEMYQRKTGRRLDFPDWVREGIKEMQDSFWLSFLDSRLTWGNPDIKLGEFSRAYVKLAKGT